jgi:hypothetical protein
MIKAAPALTEPTTIRVAPGVVLETTIDLPTKRHLLSYDICKKTIRVTKSANPNSFFEHRKCHTMGITRREEFDDFDGPLADSSTSASTSVSPKKCSPTK